MTWFPRRRQARPPVKRATPRADYIGMRRSEARLLILVNATAAASSFVGSLIVADWIAWTPVPLLVVVVGLIGCGYFVGRAEAIRRSMHDR
jgi:hypothetical protein